MAMATFQLAALCLASLLVQGNAEGTAFFVDNKEGAYLKTAKALAQSPWGPAAVSTSAATLMHAAPSKHTDAESSSQVEMLLANDMFQRPGSLVNVHLAGVPTGLLEQAGGVGTAFEGHPHTSCMLSDVDETVNAIDRIGCSEKVVKTPLECDAAPHCDGECVRKAMEMLAPIVQGQVVDGEDASYVQVPSSAKDAEATRLLLNSGSVSALAQELACFSHSAANKKERVPSQHMYTAYLDKVAGVREEYGEESPEAVAATQLTLAAVKAALSDIHQHKDGKVAAVVTAPKAATATTAREGRRRLLSNVDPKPPSTPKQYRNMVAVVFVLIILLVGASAGIFAMATMTLPQDSLLYPRTKRD